MDDEEGDSDEESVVYDLDMCPAGCSQELYDSTCQLRETHLDIEEELTEEKKILDALKKEQESLNKKTKIVESALAQAKKELEAFQVWSSFCLLIYYHEHCLYTLNSWE